MLADPVELLIDHHSATPMAPHNDLPDHEFTSYRTILLSQGRQVNQGNYVFDGGKTLYFHVFLHPSIERG